MKLLDWFKQHIKFTIKQHPINPTEIHKESKDNFLFRMWHRSQKVNNDKK